jgi:hypothetical protein
MVKKREADFGISGLVESSIGFQPVSASAVVIQRCCGSK